jgi:hypothetical protein
MNTLDQLKKEEGGKVEKTKKRQRGRGKRNAKS